MDQHKFSGFIDQDGKKIAFHFDENNLCIINTSINWDHGNRFVLKNTNGFLLGMTNDNRSVAFYIGDNKFNVAGALNIKIAAYFVSKSNTKPFDFNEKFDTLKFKNGLLKLVSDPLELVEIVEEFEDGELVRFKRNIDFDTDMIIDDRKSNVRILSYYTEKEKFNYGSALEIQVQGGIFLHEFMDFFQFAKRLVSFLIYRNLAIFDEIEVASSENPLYGADCFILFNKEVLSPSYGEVIQVKDIASHMTELVPIIIARGNSYVDFSFMPALDKRLGYMNDEKIKTICTMLESEMRYLKIETDGEIEQIQNLIKMCKKCCNWHKKTYSGELPEKTYDVIKGSMKYWKLANADRIIRLYNMHKLVVDAYAKKIRVEINEQYIKDFVKYRNALTHGDYCPLSEHVAATAECLSFLVYVCILARAGITDEEIKTIRHF